MKSTAEVCRAGRWARLLTFAGAALFVPMAAAEPLPATVSILVAPFRTLDSPSNDHCQLDKSGWAQLQTAIDEAAANFGDMIVNYPERIALSDVLTEQATYQKLAPIDARNLEAAKKLAAKYMILTTYESIPNTDKCRTDARLVEVATAAAIGSRKNVFRNSEENPLGALGLDLVMELRKRMGLWVPHNTFRLIVECFSITGNGSESPNTIKTLARETTITSLSGWGLRKLKIIPREDSYCESNLAVNTQSSGGGDREVELYLRGKIITYRVGNAIRVRIAIHIFHDNVQVAAKDTEVDESKMAEISDTVSRLLDELKKQVAAPTFMQTEEQGSHD